MSTEPKLYSFSETEKRMLNAAEDTGLLAPNGRLVIYRSFEQICCEPGTESDNAPTINSMAVGNLETGQHTIINTPNTGGFVWAADSSGFIMSTWGAYGGMGIVGYVPVNNLDQPLEAILVLRFMAQRNLINVISPDGNYVLVSNQLDGLGLYLWNTHTQQGRNILQNEYVAGAAFKPDEPNTIYFIIKAGLVEYNLDTHEHELLHPELNTALIFHARFSPDLSHIAMVVNCKVYVVSLREEYVFLNNLEQPCPFYG